jgi:hypothetical protein
MAKEVAPSPRKPPPTMPPRHGTPSSPLPAAASPAPTVSNCSRCGRRFPWLWRGACRCHFCGLPYCDVCTKRHWWISEEPRTPQRCTCYNCKVTLDPDNDGYPNAFELAERETPESLAARERAAAEGAAVGHTVTDDLEAFDDSPRGLAANPSYLLSRPPLDLEGCLAPTAPGEDEEWVHLRKLNITNLCHPRKPHRASVGRADLLDPE